ncbi:PorP/SprF family type IX secretion system membrane protein [Flagellimonas zhangzhouensis]|uniref:Type IX secretion system membrane protein, PorP/SprF family n=1 Tax=Flagellimonas zhangzhouensis TaxID=1073328 RepID=A0A1H2S3K2_9FLAO|nr:PorP/SprF family type IX secretion system membrane protein [Allomuricauda zhangzhouensis]SDQ69923.1 type IX secretion system membrane protein, PorP/SprF family [Allomuricauda zhangzhouensis]SDW25724.1 type IX secretion system membrane protein, PorP/SprF family [Allomuricauda zhangzhouensis]
MLKYLVCICALAFSAKIWGQEVVLPSDFRQHNLTQFNASLWNPTYALDWNRPNAIAIWTRWQWQSIDGDPTSTFVNYTHQLNTSAVAGLGFLQHNTGTFLYSGANFNFANVFQLDENVQLMAGLNLFAFQQTVADEQFVPIDGIPDSELEGYEGFKVTFSPGFRLLINQFNVGLAFENAFGFNVSGLENDSAEYFKMITGTLSNDFPIYISNGLGDSFIRPVVYVKSVPIGDTQFGLNGLFSTSKFWVQGGYNSFYGMSGGIGATISNSFSIGGLIEFGTGADLKDEDSTFEILLSYNFKPKEKEVVEEVEVEVDTDAEELAKAEAQAEQERLAQAEAARYEQEALEQQRLTQLQREKDSLAQVEQRKLALEEEMQRKQDSIAALQNEKVVLQVNEKYEEVESEDGLAPGFYLIANVYGTQKYFQSFMKSLKDKGLEPKSFYRSLNKYNYVYLERYNTMDEARKARDSKFFGKYPDKTWIFRVLSEK